MTGDDGEGFMLATGAIIGWEPILGETSGEGVAEKSRGMAQMVGGWLAT